MLGEKDFYFQIHRQIFLYRWETVRGRKKKCPQGGIYKSMASEKIQCVGKNCLYLNHLLAWLN